jgi:predicted RecA/RadA family phage recombinase
MKNGRIPFPQSTVFQHTNPSSTVPIAAGSVVVIGSIGYAIAVAAIAPLATGAVETRGRFIVPKATGAGTALVRGEAVGFDAANNRVRKGSSGLGTVAQPAADADTTVEIELNDEPTEIVLRVAAGTANACTINTNTGLVPTGAYFVQVFATDGTVRVITDVDWLTAGNAGQVTITATGMTATDIVMLRFIL